MATNYGQVESVMSGDPNGVHQTMSDDLDFNTNLPASTTDAGGLTTTYGYDAALNPISAIFPIVGTSAAAGFDYANLQTTSSTTYNDTSQTNCGGTVSKTVTSTTKYDGWGRIFQKIEPNGAQVNTTYDAMGADALSGSIFHRQSGLSL